MVAEEVLVVEEKFFEAGAGDVHEAQLGLRGSSGGTTAFGDVLATGAGGLHHLVHEARTPVHELFAEPDGGVVDERRSLEATGIAIAAAGSKFAHAANWFRLT